MQSFGGVEKIMQNFGGVDKMMSSIPNESPLGRLQKDSQQCVGEIFSKMMEKPGRKKKGKI